jgi:hypothetical protein
MSKMTGTPEKHLESTAEKSEDGQLIFLNEIQVASKGSLVAGRVSKKQTLRDTAFGRKVFAFTLPATSTQFKQAI